MPTGNLKPKVFVIGEAPGVGDGQKKGFDRVFVYGRTSHFLRMVLLKSKLYYKTWFTNLLKCSLENNRRATKNEFDECLKNLINELTILKPDIIITLGANVKDFFLRRVSKLISSKQRVISLRHPSYFLYQPNRKNEYLKQFQEIKEML
jgi:DNA polymerase